MNKHEKLLQKILNHQSDADIHFDALCRLLIYLNFEEHVNGSHHLFEREGVEDQINLQKQGKQAKPYQVKQVRKVLLKYNLKG